MTEWKNDLRISSNPNHSGISGSLTQDMNLPSQVKAKPNRIPKILRSFVRWSTSAMWQKEDSAFPPTEAKTKRIIYYFLLLLFLGNKEG